MLLFVCKQLSRDVAGCSQGRPECQKLAHLGERQPDVVLAIRFAATTHDACPKAGAGILAARSQFPQL